MFDIGWPELLIVAVLTIIVVGPKDLPRVLRTIFHWVRKARAMAREFQDGVDDMVRDAKLDDFKKEFESVSDLDLNSELEKHLDPDGDLAREMDLSKVEEDLEILAREQSGSPDAIPEDAETPIGPEVISESGSEPLGQPDDVAAPETTRPETTKQDG